MRLRTPMALALAGLLLQDRGREGLGGALVGTAAMIKMAPALLVLWMALRGRWRGVAGAVGAAVGLQLLSLAVFDAAMSWHFYSEVLPGFSRGDYNGMPLEIGLFANHGVPDLANRIWPGETVYTLSPSAVWASRVAALAMVGGLGLAFWRPPADRLQTVAQVGAVGVVMLLVPVYSFEHHLVWALPAGTAVVLGLLTGRLPRWVGPLAALAVLIWLLPRPPLKGLGIQLGWDTPAALAVRELKFAALVTLGLLCVGLGRGPSERAKATP